MTTPTIRDVNFLTPEWVAVVISVVTAAGSATGFAVSRRDARQSRRAAAASDQVAQAALAETKRMAASQESVAASLSKLSTRTDNMESVFDQYFGKRSADWEILYRKGDAYDIQNIGEASAYEVEITCINEVVFQGPEITPEWKPGTAETIMAAGSLQTGTPRITIHWRSTPIDPKVQEWSRPIPPKR